MTPQTLLAVRAVVIFVAGIFASRGLISQDAATWLASPEVMAFIGGAAALITAGVGLWTNRPHGIIKSAAALPQVDAVVVAPNTATEIQVPNVVPAPGPTGAQ